MAKTSKSILFAYAICDAIKQKWQNVLDSFHHKDEGEVITDVDTDAGTMTLSDESVLELGAKLKEDFIPTVTIEGVQKGVAIPAGSNAIEWLKLVFGKYIPPSIASLTLDYSVSQPLVGQPVTVTDAVFSFGNDSDGNKPTNIELSWNGQTDTIAGTDVNKEYIDINDANITSFTKTKNTHGSLTFATLTSKDAEDNDLSRTTSKTFYHQFMIGTSSVLVDDQQKATALFAAMTKTNSNSKNHTINGSANTTDGNNYTYWAVASDVGTVTSVKDGGVEDITGSWIYIGEYDYDNTFKSDVKMKFYRLNAPGALGIGKFITIS